ncbi:MAG: ribonuclease D, partial [Rhodobiaceae bacterium]|nr:ribonuclease D [Rhodobiaceae bacterium]
TEFMRESTYWSKLCLVQLAGRDKLPVIVDSMADGLSLEPLFRLLADESVIKVFHAARQDVEIFHHMTGDVPSPLFDTQVAAAVCGYGEQVAYDQLVRRTSGANIDKSHRFTDWSRRPLSEKQLHYAAADVEHLIDVYEALAAELEQSGRSEWIGEEIAVLSSPSTYSASPEEAWKRLKLRARKPVELAATQALAAWREEAAQARDVPRSRIVKDDMIYDVAAQLPDTREALGQLRSVPKGFERSQSGGEILDIVGRVKALPRDRLPAIPRNPRPNGQPGAVADLMKVLLKAVSEQHKVASRLIANVDDIEQIALDDNADVPALHGWRRKIFGELALDLKHGRLTLGIRGRSVEVTRTGE